MVAGSSSFKSGTYIGITVNIYCDGIRGLICLVDDCDTLKTLSNELSDYHPEKDLVIAKEIDDHLTRRLLEIRAELMRALDEKKQPDFDKIKGVSKWRVS